MANKRKLNLSKDELTALARMAYAENASQDNNTVKMTVQSALNRLLSGRKKEFGGSIPEILQKGYYAVKDNTPLYQQAIRGKFPDLQSKARFAEIQKLTEAIAGDEDYGNVQFYFTKDEKDRLSRAKKFDFSKVKPVGKVGKYLTFSY